MDVPFAAYPDNFGHWAEVLLPIYNFVKEQQWPAHIPGPDRQIDTLVFTNLRKEVLSVSPAILLTLLGSELYTASCHVEQGRLSSKPDQSYTGHGPKCRLAKWLSASQRITQTEHVVCCRAWTGSGRC